MGGGGDTKWECPDWRQYKIENVPELVEVRKRLAQKGLKNPWLRNEVWRYQYRIGNSNWQGLIQIAFRGFKMALLATVVTVAAQKFIFTKEEDSHH